MKSTGYILNGVYHKGGEADLSDERAVTDKSHDHDRQRENHARDLIQPRLRDGRPNPEFIEQYPEEAKNYGFTEVDNGIN